MKLAWRDGNRLRLLENGEAYFPRVFEAIAQAHEEVYVETFILFEDEVGRQLAAALIAAAQRGVRVELTVDGYGSAELSDAFVHALTEAGVRVRVFDPGWRLFGLRLNLFRRLHRKIVVVDSRLAFIGGINFSHDHLRSFGEQSKQDYAVEVEGPVVLDLQRLAAGGATPRRWRPRAWWWPLRRILPVTPEPGEPVGSSRCALVVRDNQRHRKDIEREYRRALRLARQEVIIGNAYFLPGYRLLRDLRNAARRGVKVTLILQGNPDMPWVSWGTGILYDYLLRNGVAIFEYCERPLHGKVAVMDEEWSTVGSSNLDPLSLALNLEANLVIQDRAFAAELKGRLQHLVQHCCRAIRPGDPRKRLLWREVLGVVLFHVLRRFPAWAGWLPAHVPVRAALLPPESAPKPGARAPRPLRSALASRREPEEKKEAA